MGPPGNEEAPASQTGATSKDIVSSEDHFTALAMQSSEGLCAGGGLHPECKPRREDLTSDVGDPSADQRRIEPEWERAFWQSRDELTHIKNYAIASYAAPWATLGSVLARVVCAMPPELVIPPTIAGETSLNLFFGIVGLSGSGKQAGDATARRAFNFRFTLTELQPGSGEGLIEAFSKYHKQRPPTRGSDAVPGYFERVEERILFQTSEIDTFTAITGRKGSTLIPILRAAWQGEQLGAANREEKVQKLDRHTYRLCLILNIQPGQAEPLLSDGSGGTPQRFVWLPAINPHAPAPKDTPTAPDPISWSRPGIEDRFKAPGGLVVLRIPERVIRDIEESRMPHLRGEADPDTLDGHAPLARLKVAVALALLAGRIDVNGLDWDLAEQVMRKSDQTRASMQGTLSRAKHSEQEARGVAQGYQQVKAQEVITESGSKKLGNTIIRRWPKGVEWASRTQLRNAAAGREKKLFRDALDYLIETSQIEQQEVMKKGNHTAEYRRLD